MAHYHAIELGSNLRVTPARGRGPEQRDRRFGGGRAGEVLPQRSRVATSRLLRRQSVEDRSDGQVKVSAPARRSAGHLGWLPILARYRLPIRSPVEEGASVDLGRSPNWSASEGDNAREEAIRSGVK